MLAARKKNTVPNEPEDHALGRSQGGFTTKIHVKTDRLGHVLGIVLTPGQCHESTQFEAVMESGPTPVTPVEIEPMSTTETTRPESATTTGRPKAVAGDKASSAQRIRDWCAVNQIEDVIPTRANEPPRGNFDKEKYRQRNIIERAIGWLKECRRVLTRFEKYAFHYLAFVQLAIIQRFLNTEL